MTMKKKEKMVRKDKGVKRVHKPDASVDHFAPMRNCDRGTVAGFRKYMEANPLYFKSFFPGMTVDDAVKGVGVTM
jgi:hypothetical protein